MRFVRALGIVGIAACSGASTTAPVMPAASGSPPSGLVDIPDTCTRRIPAREAAGIAASSTAPAMANATPSMPPPPPPVPPPPLPTLGARRAFVAPPSTLVVHAEVPLARIRQALEARVPRRVAEQRDHDIGSAGRLEYAVDRGPFGVRVEGDALVVESALEGSARACAKGRCYAGCAPAARATARVPLRLRADYKLQSSEVRIDVTRGCQVRALGGFLSIDVTPVLRSALAAETAKVKASIDRELPDFSAEARRGWAELVRPHALPLGACVVLSPRAIVQGPSSGTADVARLRFGLRATPEVFVRCPTGASAAGAGGKSVSLPRLTEDPSLPPVGDVHLSLVLPEEAPIDALVKTPVVDLAAGRTRIRRAAGDLAAGVLLDLGGEVCGEVGVSARDAAWTNDASVHLVGVAPLGGEAERMTGAGVDVAPILLAAERATVAVPLSAGALKSMIPELAAATSDDKILVTASVESAAPETAGLRGANVVAVALMRGAITLRAR